jgi:16S rRNA C967 or C1407 C5-methylase (RsmB/RsmF family)
MPNKKADSKKFSVTVDAKRVKMLKELTEKVGIKQNGIINMAISQLHEQEFPPKK